MKKIKISFLLILCILLISTQMKIFSQNDKFIVQEDVETIIDGFSILNFNKNGTKCLVIDKTQKFVLLIDAKTGEIIEKLNTGFYLSDSLKNSGVEANIITGRGLKIFKYDSLGKEINYSSMKEYQRYIDNRLIDAYFDSNNEIKVFASVWCIFKTGKLVEQQKIVYNGYSTFINCDKNLKIKDVNFLRYNNKEKAYSAYLLYGNDEKLYSTLSVFEMDTVSKYNKYILGEFSLKGEFLNKISKLPSFYPDKDFSYYKFEFRPLMAHNEEKTLYSFPLDNKIQFIDSDKIIKLQNIETDNLEHHKNLEKFMASKPTPIERLSYYPVKIERLFVYEDKVYVFVRVKIKEGENKYYFLMQKYDINSGKLLNEAKVNNIIRFQPFTMSKDCKYIYTTALEDENYVVRKHEVESLWEK